MADDWVPYSRRRIDDLIDTRFEAIEQAQAHTNRKIDHLASRLNLLAGALAILSILMNTFGSTILAEILKRMGQ